MSICFMSSVMNENVAEPTSSSCIHQVFNLFLKGNIHWEERLGISNIFHHHSDFCEGNTHYLCFMEGKY